MKIFPLVIVALVLVTDADAKQHRSTASRAEFIREHPCPSTGERRGHCPGWIVDHVNPLACGGTDAPGNMQWQKIADAKAKDKVELNCDVSGRPAKQGGKQGDCGGKHTCKQMSSCAEAKHYLNDCGVSRLDRDHDGIPCESICQ